MEICVKILFQEYKWEEKLEIKSAKERQLLHCFAFLFLRK